MTMKTWIDRGMPVRDAYVLAGLGYSSIEYDLASSYPENCYYMVNGMAVIDSLTDIGLSDMVLCGGSDIAGNLYAEYWYGKSRIISHQFYIPWIITD